MEEANSDVTLSSIDFSKKELLEVLEQVCHSQEIRENREMLGKNS